MTQSATFTERAAAVGDLLATHPLVRALNFHNTSRARAADYERQFEQCRRHFSPVTERDLDAYLATGRWHKPKPGMILAFYEGYRNGYDVIVPLLERYGLVGWFFIITGFIEAPPVEQKAFASRHGIGMVTNEYDDGRYALTWGELREIDRSHIVASHARSHLRIAPMDETMRKIEIVGAQQTFEKNLGHPVRSFAARSGPAYGDHAPTDRLIDEAGHQFVFSNYQIQRLRQWDRS